MNLVSNVALGAAILGGIVGTVAVEEQAHDRELFAAIAWAFLDPTKPA
jgi:hypothetical protein